MSSTAPPPHKEAAFFTRIRGWGITRGRSAVFGGVADGVGERVGLAHGPARLLLVLAAILLTGITLLAYAAAWALLPDRDGNIVIQNFGRGITNVSALIGIALFTVGGFLNLDHVGLRTDFNTAWEPTGLSGLGRYDSVISILSVLITVAISLGLVIGAVLLTVYLVRRSKSHPPVSPSTTATAAAPGPQPENPPAPASGESVAEARDAPSASAPTGTPGYPQPWERALLPGDAAMTGGPEYGTAPGAGPTPPPTQSQHQSMPAAPRVQRPRIPGPGRFFYLLTVSWILISAAIIAATDRLDRLAVSPGLAWVALFTVGFGLILAFISVAGRKLGFLGFLSVPLLLVGLLVSVNSGELGRAFDQAEVTFQNGSGDYWGDGVHYDEFGNVLEDEGASISGPTATDPTAAFADDFRQIYFAPQCYDWESTQTETWTDAESAGATASGSQARLTYASLATDTEVDVVAERTVLTIPAGTNLVLRADSNAQSTIDWESRGLQCEFWEGGQDNLSLINPGAPTLTLKVLDDAYANTIEIHETAPVEPDPASDAEPTTGPEQTPTPEPTATTEENQS